MSETATICRTLAPEDITVGIDVTVLHIEREFTALYGECDAIRETPKRLSWRERPRKPVPPLRVVGVCLPFVLAEDPLGRPKSLDVRAVRLARLDEAYAALVRDRYLAEDARRKREDAESDDTPPSLRALKRAIKTKDGDEPPPETDPDHDPQGHDPDQDDHQS